jgi:hypothetical protein
VESRGYTEDQTVEVSGVRLTLPDGMELNILEDSVTFDFAPEETKDLGISVLIPEDVEAGDYTGTLRFVFSGQNRFLPVVNTVEYHVKTFFENFWWWMLIALVILILIVVLLLLLVRGSKKAKYRFRLVTGSKKGDHPVFKIREGSPLYLELSEGGVDVNPKRSPQSIARLMAIQKGLRMTVLKSEHFPKFSDAPLDIRDFDFRVRLDLDKKKDITVRLARIQ